MDKKGYIDLAELLTRKHTISDVSSQIFVNRMFHVISNGLLNDGIVKVRGLGTFKLIEVEDRVSVDVNTGQRVVIPGHYKVSFTCDSTMKEIVNKPFSQFETVVLNDGVDFSSIDTPVESDEPNLDDDDINEEEDEIVVEKQKEQYLVETSEVEEETSAEDQTSEVEEDTIAEEQTSEVEEETSAEEQTPGVEVDTIAEDQTPKVEVDTIAEEQTPGVEEENPVENILLSEEEILPDEKVEDVSSNEKVDDVSDDKREATIGQEDADEEFNDFDDATDNSSVNDVVNDDDNIIVNSIISDDEIRNEVKDEANDEAKDDVNDEVKDEAKDEVYDEDKDEVKDEIDDNNNYDDDNSDAEPSSGSKKHIFGYIILSLILLLIAAGAYYGGYLYGYQKGRADVSYEMHKQIMKCSHHPQTPSLEKDTTNVDTITKNTPVMVNDQSSVKSERNTDIKIEDKTIVKTETKPESKTVSKALATDDLHAQYAAKDVRVRLGAYRIVGTDHEELVRPGDNVRKLSRRCLGEGMECYVEVYNGINSNTPLKAGQKLKIPKLVVKKKKKK